LRRPARADIAAGAADILDVEILAGLLRELLRDQAREQVGRAAGGESDNDLYRPRWPGLRGARRPPPFGSGWK
jgi:hypothetical protein